MSYLLEDMVKTAAWLVNKEKKQRVKAMKFLGHKLESENRDAQSYRSKADALRPQEEVLWSQLERTRKLHDDDFNARFKAQELKEQLRPEEYVKDPYKQIRERAHLSFDGPHYDNLRKAQREHDAVYGKRYDYDDDAKRHRQTAANLENDIKSQAKGYAEDFFGPNPTRKKALQRKERLIVGAGVGTAAAIGGGAYLYNRYKKKKRAQAEQEKTAIEFEKTARLTEHFLNAVKENNTRRVRIMMKDSLLNDPTFKEYREMRDAAKGIKGLYDKHDGRKYNYDKNTWNDDYLDGKMVQSINHFSPEMNQHLEDVVAHLRPEAHNAAPNPMLRNKPWPHKKMALGVGTAAAIGGGAYLYHRYKKKKRAQAEQEKTAGESMPARYKKINWENDPTGEKKKIKRKLLASGALAAAGFGVNLSQLALATRDMVKNTNHADPGSNMAGIVGGGAGLILTEKQLQKAEKLEGLPVGGAANQKKSRLDDWNLIVY